MARLRRARVRNYDFQLEARSLRFIVGLEIAGDILSHSVYGPKKKSWGIEMTIITSLMRDVGRHSHLVDIVSRRFARNHAVISYMA